MKIEMMKRLFVGLSVLLFAYVFGIVTSNPLIAMERKKRLMQEKVRRTRLKEYRG